MQTFCDELTGVNSTSEAHVLLFPRTVLKTTALPVAGLTDKLKDMSLLDSRDINER